MGVLAPSTIRFPSYLVLKSLQQLSDGNAATASKESFIFRFQLHILRATLNQGSYVTILYYALSECLLTAAGTVLRTNISSSCLLLLKSLHNAI